MSTSQARGTTVFCFTSSCLSQFGIANTCYEIRPGVDRAACKLPTAIRGSRNACHAPHRTYGEAQYLIRRLQCRLSERRWATRRLRSGTPAPLADAVSIPGARTIDLHSV